MSVIIISKCLEFLVACRHSRWVAGRRRKMSNVTERNAKRTSNRFVIDGGSLTMKTTTPMMPHCFESPSGGRNSIVRLFYTFQMLSTQSGSDSDGETNNFSRGVKLHAVIQPLLSQCLIMWKSIFLVACSSRGVIITQFRLLCWIGLKALALFLESTVVIQQKHWCPVCGNTAFYHHY